MTVPAGASIQLDVKADAVTGAPGGFSIHWVTREQWVANGEMWVDSNLMCAGSFAGEELFK
jgi:hypothetical protein